VWWRGGATLLMVGLLAAISAVAGSALLGGDGVNRLLSLRVERQELGETAVRRLQGNAALRAEIARLRSDRRYLEEFARKRLGLVQPNETVYRFVRQDAP
jgi:cell division protein FtsB/cell division protein DivIC